MSSTNTPALRVKAITRRFGNTKALDELSFDVAPGQIVGLLGRNGAGKSTLLRIISGQLKPNSGEAELFGHPVFDNVSALSGLCMIGDTPDFGKLSRIGELFTVCGGLFPTWDQAYALRLVERFELPMKKPLKGFSRGMQTALLLSVGLASGAALTVFDEPSLGLDAVMRERFYDQLLEERSKDSGRTFILSTHLIDEVARALDSAVLIDAGHLLCQGTVQELTSLYLSVSGPGDAVREVSSGFTVLKEEEMAGSLVRHLRLNTQADKERIQSDGRVQCAALNLQRLFVFLTEEKEADRHAANA
ncbi:MAG: ABC transporter ATP-binding protein [Eubacteriales bacterium]|nr:ABC transporter ATP-binding protein [Eubacteriales bacterium]